MPNLAAFLTAKYFPKSGESLVFGNFPVNQLAEIYGTPMFVYDRAVLDLKYDGRVSPFAFSLEYAIRWAPARNTGRTSDLGEKSCSDLLSF